MTPPVVGQEAEGGVAGQGSGGQGVLSWGPRVVKRCELGEDVLYLAGKRFFGG